MVAKRIHVNYLSTGFIKILASSFSNRIAYKWNKLADDIATCTSVNIFENKVYHHMYKGVIV